MDLENLVQQTIQVDTSADAPVEGETEKPQVADDFSQRLSILTKKEKGLMAKQRELEAKLKELQEKEGKVGEYSEIDKLLDENPAEFFKRKGKSFEDIQEKWLASLSDDDIDPIQKQIKELKQQLANKNSEFEKMFEEKLSKKEQMEQEKKIEEQKSEYKTHLNKFIDQNTEKYELINKVEGSREEVFELMTQVYMKTLESGKPKLLTFEEACDLYEAELEKQIEVLLQSNKVKKKLGLSEGMSEQDLAKFVGHETLDDTFAPTSSISADQKSERERELAARKMFEEMMKT